MIVWIRLKSSMSVYIHMGVRRIFFRSGQIRESGDLSPPAGSRGGAPVGYRLGQSPQKLTTNCENNA